LRRILCILFRFKLKLRIVALFGALKLESMFFGSKKFHRNADVALAHLAPWLMSPPLLVPQLMLGIMALLALFEHV